MRINLYLIRHAESKANENVFYKLLLDPNISEDGIVQCQKLGKFLEQENMIQQRTHVYSSILVRSQETALLSIPKKKVRIVNHLKEYENPMEMLFSYRGSNFPVLNVNDQQKKIKKVVKSRFKKRLSYQKGIVKNNEYIPSVSMENGNVLKFLKENKHNWKENDTVVVVCHGKLIQEFLKKPKEIENCSVIKVKNLKKDMFQVNTPQKKKTYKVLFKG